MICRFEKKDSLRARFRVAVPVVAFLAAAALCLQGCATSSFGGDSEEDDWGDGRSYENDGVLPPPEAVGKTSEQAASAPADAPKTASEAESRPAEANAAPEASDAAPATDGEEDIFKTDESQVRSKFEPIIGQGYRIKVTVMIGDKVEVGPTEVMVSDREEIILPLLGRVPCGGLTINGLHSRLASRFAEFFADPEVIVAFAYNDDGISPYGQVLVQGRVHREGWINIPPTRNLRLSHAIQRAGGFASSALRRKVLVTRRDDDGVMHRIVVDFKAIGKNGALEKDILLEPNDVIFVDESNF